MTTLDSLRYRVLAFHPFHIPGDDLNEESMDGLLQKGRSITTHRTPQLSQYICPLCSLHSIGKGKALPTLPLRRRGSMGFGPQEVSQTSINYFLIPSLSQ